MVGRSRHRKGGNTKRSASRCLASRTIELCVVRRRSRCVCVRVMRECTIGDRIIYEHFETISYLKVDQECDFLIYAILCK